MADISPHISVLQEPVLHYLAPKPGGIYCDGTLGAGGHTLAILHASDPDGTVVAIDRDETALALAERAVGQRWSRVRVVHGSFGHIADHLRHLGIDQVDGFLLDLGVSSMQLDNAHRGFSFSKEGPVDMRMDTSSGQTALDLIRDLSVDELIGVLRDLGEERFAPRIARRLKDDVREGVINSTVDLAESVAAVIPGKAKRLMRIHPATKTFQALRIAVNQELVELEQFLAAFPPLLRRGGRCVIISFHSLEDRLVKRCFRDLAWSSSLPPQFARQAGERVEPICRLLTRKPVMASDDEIHENPRARSARLRACEKVAE